MTLPGTIRYIASPIARSSALQLCGFAGWALWFCHECRLSAAVDSCELSSRMMQLPKYVQLSESLDCVQEYTGYASNSVVDTCGGARKNSPVYHSFHAICTGAFPGCHGRNVRRVICGEAPPQCNGRMVAQLGDGDSLVSHFMVGASRLRWQTYSSYPGHVASYTFAI
jgi:hypothetical protein